MPPVHRQRRTNTVSERSTRNGVSYKDSTSEESSSDDWPSLKTRRSPGKTLKSPVGKANKRKRDSLSESDRRSPSGINARSDDSHPMAKGSLVAQNRALTSTKADNGNKTIPQWHTLPYHILLQVFSYALHPLCDSNYRPLPSLQWIVNVSCLCKAFAEPALTALYRCPPLLPLDRPHALLALLKIPSEALTIDYTKKIKRLKMDVSQSLAYSSPGLGHFDLSQLIRHAPQLQELELFHLADQPPYRNTNRITERWKYQDSLFSALVEANIRLRSWRWNTRMTGPKHTPNFVEQLYRTVQFQNLQRLALVNYHPKERRPLGLNVPTEEEQIARALTVLPNLRSLSCETSTIVTNRFLHCLPKRLVCISLINCASLTSESFRPFLATHGASLKELVLNHNQSLSLSFLPDLAPYCPNLEVLTMDLTYYKFLDGTKTGHEIPLLPGEVPVWPDSMQRIELVQLRIPSSETARMFFSSLIDSASRLLQLRTLILKIILRVEWRDRANFRRKWIGRLKETFLRDKSYPDILCQSRPTISSSRGFSHVQIDKFEEDNSDTSILPKRRSTRLAKPREDSYVRPAVERSSVKQRHQLRRPRRRVAHHVESSEDTESDTSFESAGRAPRDFSSNVKTVRQGMCEIVDIRIDDTRPAEAQFNEDDFLDSELSGDNEWGSGDTLPSEHSDNESN